MEYTIEFNDINGHNPTHFVYEIQNLQNEVLYVGKTKNPRQRFYQHVKITPRLGNGTFYGRDDVKLVVIQKFYSSQEAGIFETELKTKYGFEVTERTTGAKNGKHYWLNQPGRSEALKLIKDMLAQGKYTMAEIAEASGYSGTTVYRVKHGITK